MIKLLLIAAAFAGPILPKGARPHEAKGPRLPSGDPIIFPPNGVQYTAPTRLEAAYEKALPALDKLDDKLEKAASKPRRLSRQEAAKQGAYSNYYAEYLLQYVKDMDECYKARGESAAPNALRGDPGDTKPPVWPLGAVDPDVLTIDKLVAGLGSEDFKVREAATSFARYHAERLAPLLEKLEKSPDLEVRTRATNAYSRSMVTFRACLRQATFKHVKAVFAEVHPDKQVRDCTDKEASK